MKYLILITIYFFMISCDKTNNLDKNNWEDNVHAALVNLVEKNGVKSKNYDENNKPYVVFDFDNTTAFNDVEEALLIYQLENLLFAFKPEEITSILETGIPDVNAYFKENYSNQSGKKLNVRIVAEDIQQAYKYLYKNYTGLGNQGEMSLDEIKETTQYKAFITKVRFLYEAVNGSFDSSVGYPWVTYLFTGMTPDEVRDLTIKSNDYWLAYEKFGKITWTTPESYKGNAGIVSTSFKTGLDFPKEMRNLYAYFMNNGIEVYVCSASFIDVIVASANTEKYGYNVAVENIYAMQLKKDAAGKYINEFNTDYFQTQGEGKAQTINKFIKPLHNNIDPIFVAGDSSGDYEMLTQYQSMQLGLIIDRNQQKMNDLVDDTGRYVLQGRNENTGSFIPSKKSILLSK